LSISNYGGTQFPSWLFDNSLSKILASLERNLGTNTSLETLSIGNMNVKSFPDESLLPLSLTSMWIYSCGDLQNLDYKSLCLLSFLEELILEHCPQPPMLYPNPFQLSKLGSPLQNRVAKNQKARTEERLLTLTANWLIIKSVR